MTLFLKLGSSVTKATGKLSNETLLHITQHLTYNKSIGACESLDREQKPQKAANKEIRTIKCNYLLRNQSSLNIRHDLRPTEPKDHSLSCSLAHSAIFSQSKLIIHSFIHSFKQHSIHSVHGPEQMTPVHIPTANPVHSIN